MAMAQQPVSFQPMEVEVPFSFVGTRVTPEARHVVAHGYLARARRLFSVDQ